MPRTATSVEAYDSGTTPGGGRDGQKGVREK